LGEEGCAFSLREKETPARRYNTDVNEDPRGDKLRFEEAFVGEREYNILSNGRKGFRSGNRKKADIRPLDGRENH